MAASTLRARRIATLSRLPVCVASREKMRPVEPRAATRKPDTFTGWLGVLREGRI